MSYPEEYKQRLVELVRSGRSAANLAQEFEPSEKAIREWAQRAGVLKRRGHAEAQVPVEEDLEAEVRRLRSENARLREEREILKKAAAWFAMESETGSKRRSGS